MGRPNSVVALYTIGALLAGAAGACRRSPPDDRGDLTVRIAAAVPPVRLARAGVNALVERLTTEPLLATGSNGRAVAGLADSWIWDAGHLRLRLKLHAGVLFHDGTPLSAAIASESALNALRDSPPASLTSIESIAAIDDRTVEVRLREPDSFLIEDLAGVSLTLPKQHQVGNGPFALVDNTSDHIRLRAFPQYYRGRPALQNLEIDLYPTQRNAWAAMLRDQADVLYEVSRDALEFVQAETRVRTYSYPRPYYVMLAFNVRHPALGSAAVRRAINQAIDRNGIVREGLRGQGRPADGPLWPEHWAYAKPRHSFGFDPDAAERELDGAGFRMPSATTGDRRRSRLSFTCLVYHEDSRFERTALLVQKQLYDIGIDMQLEPVGLVDMMSRISAGNFEAFLFEGAGGKSWTYTLWHSPRGQTLIDSGYHSADAVLDRLRHATSDEAERAAIADLNEVFSSDPPAAFLAWQSQTRAASRRLSIPDEPGQDILSSGVQLWTLRSPAQVARR